MTTRRPREHQDSASRAAGAAATFPVGSRVLFQGAGYTVTGEWRGYLVLFQDETGTSVKAPASQVVRV